MVTISGTVVVVVVVTNLPFFAMFRCIFFKNVSNKITLLVYCRSTPLVVVSRKCYRTRGHIGAIQVLRNVDWMLESIRFPRGPSMYGINYQLIVYMLLVFKCVQE